MSDPDRVPPDGTEESARVCVVATRDPTFDRCRAGFYPAPRSYPRTTAEFDYLACYRTAPRSAITHYAAVTDRIEQRRGEPGPMDAADWQATIDADETDVVVFELGALIALNSAVENDRSGVRGAWYCTLEGLREAETLSELAAHSGE